MGLQEVAFFGQSHLYRNTLARPRAWVESKSGDFSAVQELDWSYNRIAIRAQGPGLLVLSELVYPGWRVQVDGQPAKLHSYAGLLRATDLGVGQHEIIFTFAPRGFWVGLPISAAAWLGLLFWPQRGRKVKKN